MRLTLQVSRRGAERLRETPKVMFAGAGGEFHLVVLEPEVFSTHRAALFVNLPFKPRSKGAKGRINRRERSYFQDSGFSFMER